MKRRHRIIVMVGTGLILISTYLFIAYLRSPYRVFRQIITAMERKDIDTIYKFILDEEKKMGITKEVVRRSLDDILYKNATVVKACRTPLEQIQGKVTSDVYYFYSGWMDEVTGKPLPSFRKVTKGVMTLKIDLYKPTGRGWQMSFTRLAMSYSALNFPQDKAGQIFRLSFRKWGITAIYEPPPYIMIRRRIYFLWDKPRWRKVPP